MTHYEAYFDDPARELTRLCAALGLPTTPAMVDAAVATIQTDLNHHAAAAPAPVPDDVLRFYDARLRDGDDPAAAPAPSSHRESLLQSQVLTLAARVDDRRAECDDLATTLAARTAERDLAAAQLAGATDAIAARDGAIAALQQRLANEQAEVHRLDAALDALHLDADAVRAEARTLRAELSTLTQGRAWSVLERVWALRLRFVPRGSRRERLLGLGPRRPSMG